MADERDEEQFGTEEGKEGQQTTGQKGQQSELGQKEQPIPMGQQGQQPTGQQGQQRQFGQQGQSATGQTRPGTGSDTITGERSGESRSGGQGEGFVGSQGAGSDEYLRERGGTTSGSDFAKEGRGALEKEEGEEDESGTGSTGGGSGGGGGGSF